MSSHYAVNQAIECLLKVLFALNRKFIPPEKWRLYCSYSLKWLPSNFKEHIRKALLTRKYTLEDVERRVRILRSLWKEVLPKVEKEVGLSFDKFYEYSINIEKPGL